MAFRPRKSRAGKDRTRMSLRISLLKRRYLSFLKKTKIHPFHSVHAITISIDGLTEEQIAFLKDAEAKGLIPKITWIESSPDSTDDKMKYALVYLHSEDAEAEGCNIRRDYDYAWIKIALRNAPERYSKLRYMSTPKFVDYIKSLGFDDIAGPKTLNKFLAQAGWISDWHELSFPKQYINRLEVKRRNRISRKFLELINEV